MMRHLILLAASVGLWFAGGSGRADDLGAYDRPMTFIEASNGNCRDCAWVSAMGVIDRDAPQRFRDFAQWYGPFPATVTLHSPGGDLAAALALGRAIRAAGMSSSVAETVVPDPEAPIVADRRPGRCLGACAYAFLGGIARALPEGATLGFAAAADAGGLVAGADSPFLQGQRTAGILVTYLADMGVDPRLLPLAAGAALEQPAIPDATRLAALRIVTPTGFAQFVVQPMPAGAGAVAASDNLDATDAVRRVDVFCRRRDRQPYVTLHIASYHDRPYGQRYTPAEFLQQMSGALVIAGTRKLRLNLRAARVVLAEPDYQLALPLSRQAVAALTAATDVTVATQSYHAFYDFGPAAALKLSRDDRDAIRLALRSCI